MHREGWILLSLTLWVVDLFLAVLIVVLLVHHHIT